MPRPPPSHSLPVRPAQPQNPTPPSMSMDSPLHHAHKPASLPPIASRTKNSHSKPRSAPTASNMYVMAAQSSPEIPPPAGLAATPRTQFSSARNPTMDSAAAHLQHTAISSPAAHTQLSS